MLAVRRNLQGTEDPLGSPYIPKAKGYRRADLLIERKVWLRRVANEIACECLVKRHKSAPAAAHCSQFVIFSELAIAKMLGLFLPEFSDPKSIGTPSTASLLIVAQG